MISLLLLLPPIPWCPLRAFTFICCLAIYPTGHSCMQHIKKGRGAVCRPAEHKIVYLHCNISDHWSGQPTKSSRVRSRVLESRAREHSSLPCSRPKIARSTRRSEASRRGTRDLTKSPSPALINPRGSVCPSPTSSALSSSSDSTCVYSTTAKWPYAQLGALKQRKKTRGRTSPACYLRRGEKDDGRWRRRPGPAGNADVGGGPRVHRHRAPLRRHGARPP
jgi:hypothetical protein